MAQIEVLRDLILLEQVQKGTVQLHLPDEAKNNHSMYIFVVQEVGTGVSIPVKAGDTIIPFHVGQQDVVMCDIGEGEKAYLLVQENRIGAIQR